MGLISMVNQSIPANASQNLEDILQEMEACISEQESIILEERAAMKIFNAAALTELVERRARTQSVLNELESRCKRMLTSSDNESRMEQLINRCAPDNADNLQSIRIDLARRMQSLEQSYVENHIRLRAAWNVTTNILQHVGAIEVKPTYANTSYAQQAPK